MSSSPGAEWLLAVGTRVWNGQQGAKALFGIVMLYQMTDCPWRSSFPVRWDNHIWQMVGAQDVTRVRSWEEPDIRDRERRRAARQPQGHGHHVMLSGTPTPACGP